MSTGGWIAVDLDGTLAKYDGWVDVGHIGEPVPLMVERVRAWLREGRDVRIFTARVFPIPYVDEAGRCYPDEKRENIHDAMRAAKRVREWCMEHLGRPLPITCQKDYGMIELWDDRCVQVEPNTGQRVDGL